MGRPEDLVRERMAREESQMLAAASKKLEDAAARKAENLRKKSSLIAIINGEALRISNTRTDFEWADAYLVSFPIAKKYAWSKQRYTDMAVLDFYVNLNDSHVCVKIRSDGKVFVTMHISRYLVEISEVRIWPRYVSVDKDPSQATLDWLRAIADELLST